MLKHAHHVLTGALLAATVCATMPSWAQDNPVLRRFGAGLGLDSVGMVDASEDVEVAGPQAIYAGEGNEVYLLDQVNGRVLSFDPTQANAPTRSFRLPADLQPTDLIVRRGKILVWDGDVHVLRDRKSTRLNSSHQIISYAVFCLKKKKKKKPNKQ